MSEETPAAGTLIVGRTKEGDEIVINHPDLKPDASGCGYIVFSAEQAENLARILSKHATDIRRERMRRMGRSKKK